jgi:predicted SprT family Zn-dependent metalloprotease
MRMKTGTRPCADHRWHALLTDWAQRWGVPGLERRLSVQISTRLRTSLGRYSSAQRELRVASYLLDGPPSLLREVLCHEAAHAAVYERHGRSTRPHGPEWQALMREAGFAPRVRIPAAELDGLPLPARRARILWEHRCPVCQASRVAGRPVREWRCAACRAAGLSGKLVIERATAVSVLDTG